MPFKKKPTFKTIPMGTSVSWHYRSAIGHGTVTGVHKPGTTADNTMIRLLSTTTILANLTSCFTQKKP